MNQELEKKFLSAYSKYSDAIFRYIFFKINNREKTLDFVQETFMKTWIYMLKNGEPKNTRAFLYTVAGNLVIDEYRRRNRKDYNTDSLDKLREDGFEPKEDGEVLETLMNKHDGEKVVKIISELPEIYSSVLYLKYIEELSIGEIAENMSVSVNVVSVRLNRGLKKLKEVVESINGKQ